MAGAGGAGSGCQPLIPHMPEAHMSTWAPAVRLCTCTCTQTHGSAHTCTHMCPLGLITLTHALQSHASSHTCPHGMEKGRSRRGGAELGKGQLSPDPAAEADPGVQPPDAEAPARPSGLAAGARSTGLAKRTVAMDGASAYYVPGTVLRALGMLARCLLLTPTCEKGSY